jgi:polysaccharide biosynthesis/export protein
MPACAHASLPGNREAELYDKEKTGENDQRTLSFSKQQCPPAGTANYMAFKHGNPVGRLRKVRMRYSPGDRINLFIPGAPEFSGDYVINADGLLVLPFSNQVDAVGLTNDELTGRIHTALVSNRIFRSEHLEVSVRPVLFAAVNITISGAVFLPGRFTIGGVKDSDKGEKAMTKSGDLPAERFVAAALRAGGGIRPDADLTRIKLVRKGKSYNLNWSGALIGKPVDDIALIEDDHIEVEETGCFQSALVRPSQITPPGIRIFQSNLTQPANSNANSAIAQQSQNIPYGTRFLAGLVSSNCVGGSLATNANRYGVLISRNPKTMRTEVIQRSVEELVRSPDRDTINPYLMPDDAIACYDSAATDLKEVASLFQTLLVPAQTGHVFRSW